MRELLPETLFLSPGYGAQGGDASGVRPLLDRSGGGVLVNSSRSILYAYESSAQATKKPPEKPPAKHETNYLQRSPTVRARALVRGGFQRRVAQPQTNRDQTEKRWATASTVTSTVAAATTTPRTCTMLSLLIFSFREARGYGSGSCPRRALWRPFSGSLARASSMAFLRLFS